MDLIEKELGAKQIKYFEFFFSKLKVSPHSEVLKLL